MNNGVFKKFLSPNQKVWPQNFISTFNKFNFLFNCIKKLNKRVGCSASGLGH